MQQQQSKFKSGQDLSHGYSSNFNIPENSTMKSVETLIVTTVFKKLVSKLTGKLSWFKSQENSAIYNDTRGLINYVKINHGSVFRRVVLSAMLDSTKKLVKTQYKVDGEHVVR